MGVGAVFDMGDDIDLQKLEDALNRDLGDHKDDGSGAPTAVEYMGRAYVRGDLVNGLLNANFLVRQRLETRSKQVERREASVSKMEKDMYLLEEEKAEIMQRLERTTDELYALREKMRQYEGTVYKNDDFSKKEEETEMQKAVVDASKTVSEYEDQLKQRDTEIEKMSDRILELEAEIERLMRENADS